MAGTTNEARDLPRIVLEVLITHKERGGGKENAFSSKRGINRMRRGVLAL